MLKELEISLQKNNKPKFERKIINYVWNTFHFINIMFYHTQLNFKICGHVC